MKFDDILVEYVGEFGRYQQIQYLLVNLPVILTAMHVLSWTFTSEVLPHRCIYIGENESTPFDIGLHYLEESIPANATLESCKDGYRWKPTSYVSSAVSRWDLVCDKKWVRSFVQLLYYVGQFVGSYVCGRLSDRYGRKVVFLGAIVLQFTCGLLMAFVPYWPLFAVLRIGLGFAHPGIFIIAVVIGSELVGPRYRVLAGVGAGAFFSVGQILLGAIAYLFDRYEYLQLTISLPAVMFLGYHWLVPESARWLLIRNRFSEAYAILDRAARFNGRSLPAGLSEAIELDPSQDQAAPQAKPSVWDLFRRPVLLRRTLIAFYCWMAVSCVYYALSINPSFLGGDVNTSFIFGGVLELPALFVVLLTINRFGRRLILIIGFVLCTVLMFTTLLFSDDYKIVKLVLVLLSKSALCGVYSIIYVYSSELFPTVIRNTAVGLCSMIARLGAVAASYFALWLAEDYAVLVSVLYGVIALIGSGLTIMLPETAGKPLAETMDDAERLGGTIFSCNCRRGRGEKITE